MGSCFLGPVDDFKGPGIHENGIRVGAAGVDADAVTNHEKYSVFSVLFSQ